MNYTNGYVRKSLACKDLLGSPADNIVKQYAQDWLEFDAKWKELRARVEEDRNWLGEETQKPMDPNNPDRDAYLCGQLEYARRVLAILDKVEPR